MDCGGRRDGVMARLAALVLLALVSAGGPVLAAAPDEEVETALGRAYAAGDYQRELPLYEASEGEGRGGDHPMADPDWWRNEGDAQAPDLYRPGSPDADSDVFDFEIPPALRQVLRVLMWIVFVAGGALVAYYLLNEARLFSRWKKAGWQSDGAAGAAGVESTAPSVAALEDPESLAARGEYAEAVHVLLLRSIMLIRDRGAALSTSLTSREILLRAPLEEPEKDAFKTLVGVTELTHFGGRDATEDDFLRCRDLFHRIAQSAAGGAA